MEREMEYQLTGQVNVDAWFERAEEALAAYNDAVAAHNLACKKESDEFAFVERINFSTWEDFVDGSVEYQWPNPSRNCGMLFLEARPRESGSAPVLEGGN